MTETNKPKAGKPCQDTQTFTALYEQYAAQIFTYFQYRCDDSATAGDLTMQVFERLLRCLPDYDAARAPFSAWLFSIARHTFVDWQRRQYLRKFIPWEDFSRQPSADPGPEQAALESEQRRSLRRALAQLSTRERDLVGLRFSSGLTNRAIAGLTGLSETNVAVILYRALRKLRQHLVDPLEIPCPDTLPLTEVGHE